uniref:BPTI/Kunitz inhibitor domain-containing protein n=1 Tax=Daphnia magna TaxID=35525 RepID=A0A0P6FEV0_9CRUS
MLLFTYVVVCLAVISPIFSAEVGTPSTVPPTRDMSKVKHYGMCGRPIFPNTELCSVNGTKTVTLWAFDSQALKCVTFQNCGRFPHSLNFFPSDVACKIICEPTRLALTLKP